MPQYGKTDRQSEKQKSCFSGNVRFYPVPTPFYKMHNHIVHIPNGSAWNAAFPVDFLTWWSWRGEPGHYKRGKGKKEKERRSLLQPPKSERQTSFWPRLDSVSFKTPICWPQQIHFADFNAWKMVLWVCLGLRLFIFPSTMSVLPSVPGTENSVAFFSGFEISFFSVELHLFQLLFYCVCVAVSVVFLPLSFLLLLHL